MCVRVRVWGGHGGQVFKLESDCGLLTSLSYRQLASDMLYVVEYLLPQRLLQCYRIASWYLYTLSCIVDLHITYKVYLLETF